MLPFPRVPAARSPNRLTLAVQRAGRIDCDLTLSNPTAAGLAYPPDLLAPLALPAALRYTPDPLGLRAAREAVSADYARRGSEVAPGRIVLTASTSDAYSLLFRLLCRPDGDRILVPAPSYPLFEHLARLDGVAIDTYGLDYHGRWCLDVSSLDAGWHRSTRAVLAVSPNNPTGSVLTAEELTTLDDRCARADAALIVDEVFADFLLDGATVPTPPEQALTFRLGGLSKSIGLPQVKLGWIAVGGPARLVDTALDALALIADTYLAVSTPVQVAAPTLLARGAEVRRQIGERVRRNYAALREAAGRYPAVDLMHCEAGWSAVLRVPATQSEEDLVIGLLERHGVLVHPGFFFDMPHEAFVIVSLLPDPGIFDRGVARLLEHVNA